jgi:hypothetical protein
MSKEQLVGEIKRIVALTRASNWDEAYKAYQALFSDPEFLQNRAEDQRQALRLLVHGKGPSKPTPALMEAHRAAVLPLTELVSLHDEPSDYEMLGMCHLMLGNTEAASRMFRVGLGIERERDAGSTLCGALMRRISEI